MEGRRSFVAIVVVVIATGGLYSLVGYTEGMKGGSVDGKSSSSMPCILSITELDAVSPLLDLYSDFVKVL